MITCSAVPKKVITQLRNDFDLSILKIDHPMAHLAVQSGTRIAVVVTFPPTLEPTCKLLSEAAAEAGITIDMIQEVSPEAYHALLTGDTKKHDDLFSRLLSA